MLDVVNVAGLPNYYIGWISLLFLLAALIYWFDISGYTVTSHVALPGPKRWKPLGCI